MNYLVSEFLSFLFLTDNWPGGQRNSSLSLCRMSDRPSFIVEETS